MSRLHADPVEVRTRTEAAGPVPDQFLWRGRLYLVREVLARWTESGSWWRGTAVRALTTGAGHGEGSGPPAGPSVAVDDREQLWWRVEADSGRLAALSGGRGTYDLCFDWSSSAWSLTRVMD
ncbi:MAG: DUF6504 family protein [Mycobacteriales bacterium]